MNQISLKFNKNDSQKSSFDLINGFFWIGKIIIYGKI